MKMHISVKVLSIVFLFVSIFGVGFFLFPQSQIEVEITVPGRDGIRVGKEMTVEGTAGIPSGKYLWIMVHRTKGFKYVWWPQGEAEIDPVTKKWEVFVVFGGQHDIGFEFEIAAIVVNETEHSKLRAYCVKAMSSGHRPPIPMPPTEDAPVLRIVRKANND